MFGLFVRKHAEAVAIYNEVACLYVFADHNISKTEIHINKLNIHEIIVYYPINSSDNSLIKFIKYAKAYLQGFHYLKNNWGKADIIQANVFTRTAIVALIYKIIHKTPYAVIEHWTRYFRTKTFNNKLHHYLSIQASKHANAVLPVTTHLQKCMEKHGMVNSNYIIINNVVDDIFYETITTPNNSKTRIINVTCFDDQQKNLTGILNTIYKLSKTRTDFEIYLVGTGNDFEKIKSYSDKLDLTNKFVFFTGMRTNLDLVKLYQESHFTLLFSNYENIPVVISESLASGLPVISTDVGGIKEHINSENGILIKPMDEESLFSAIEYMINHYATYNKAEIKRKALEKYSQKAVGAQLNNIYNTILQHDHQTNI
jgi:glycosyltransferase involved in cell wall biosynthesis